MAVQVGLGRSNFVPISVASLCPCSRARPFLKPLEFPSASTKLNIRLTRMVSDDMYGIPVTILTRHRTVMAVARAEPDRLDEGEAKEVGISDFFLLVLAHFCMRVMYLR